MRNRLVARVTEQEQRAFPRRAGTVGGGALAVLRCPEFRFLFVGDLAFYFAMIGQFALRSILAWELTHSAVALSVISLAMGLPMLLLAPFGGVVADRVERRGLIIFGQLIILVNGLIILALLAFDALLFWHLLVTTVVAGCAFPIISPARQALVADLVPRELLSNAFALAAGNLNLARVAGPAGVGLLYPWCGATMTWGLSVAIYAAGIVALMGVPRSQAVGEQHAGLSALLAAGRYLGGHPVLRAVFLLGFIPALIGMPFQSLLIVFADEIWHTGAEGFGLLQAAAGLGAVTGSLVVAHQSPRHSTRSTLLISLTAFGLLLSLFALCPNFWLALVLAWLAMACGHVFVTTNTVTVHLLCDDAMRGRMGSIVFATMSLPSLGSMPMALVAQHYGAPAAVALAGGLVALLGLLLFACSAPLRHLDRRLGASRT